MEAIKSRVSALGDLGRAFVNLVKNLWCAIYEGNYEILSAFARMIGDRASAMLITFMIGVIVLGWIRIYEIENNPVIKMANGTQNMAQSVGNAVTGMFKGRK